MFEESSIPEIHWKSTSIWCILIHCEMKCFYSASSQRRRLSNLTNNTLHFTLYTLVFVIIAMIIWQKRTKHTHSIHSHISARKWELSSLCHFDVISSENGFIFRERETAWYLKLVGVFVISDCLKSHNIVIQALNKSHSINLPKWKLCYTTTIITLTFSNNNCIVLQLHCATKTGYWNN